MTDTTGTDAITTPPLAWLRWPMGCDVHAPNHQHHMFTTHVVFEQVHPHIHVTTCVTHVYTCHLSERYGGGTHTVHNLHTHTMCICCTERPTVTSWMRCKQYNTRVRMDSSLEVEHACSRSRGSHGPCSWRPRSGS